MKGLGKLLTVAVVATAMTAASAAGSAARLAPRPGAPAHEQQASMAADGPTVITLDTYIAFKRGAVLRGTDGDGARVAATYGWRARDPQGICSQDLSLEAIVPDLFIDRDNLPGSARSASIRARVGGSTIYEDRTDSIYLISLDVTDCAGNMTTEDGGAGTRCARRTRLPTPAAGSPGAASATRAKAYARPPRLGPRRPSRSPAAASAW